MLKICLVFWQSELQYAYKRYASKRKNMYLIRFKGHQTSFLLFYPSYFDFILLFLHFRILNSSILY